MKRLLLILALLALAPAAFAQDGYQNRAFTINAPSSPTGLANSQPVLMSLPFYEGFAPNVNVQVQVYPDSLDTYVRLSEGQFRSLNWTVLDHQLSGNKATFEYTGDYNGRTMHWYAEAIKQSDRVYLVTATALAAQWPSVSARLVASVKSFRLRQ